MWLNLPDKSTLVQVITRGNADPKLCRHMASLGRAIMCFEKDIARLKDYVLSLSAILNWKRVHHHLMHNESRTLK